MIAEGSSCDIYNVSDNSGRASGSELVVIIKMVMVATITMVVILSRDGT